MCAAIASRGRRGPVTARILVCTWCSAVLAAVSFSQTTQPEIPTPWDDRQVASFEVPLAQPDRSPRYLNQADYYALPVRTIYRGYPVYAPDKEPPGYMRSLATKEPEIAFDAAKL